MVDTTSADFLLGKTTPGMPSYQPAVQPSPQGGGSLQGTMTSAPPASVAPTVTSIPSSSSSTTPFALAQVMDALQTKVQTNNALMSQRQLLLKDLYDQKLTPDELNQLDPTFRKAIEDNDRNQIDLHLRLISDEIAGRNDSLDKSVQYLTSTYKDTLAQAEKQRQNEIDNVLNFAKVYGSGASKALASLYGDSYVQDLKNQGINLDKFTSIPTQDQIKNGGGLPGTSSFTKTQLNNGASSAAVGLDDFKTYDYESQNYFINRGSDVTKARKAIDDELASGTDLDSILKEIGNYGLPQRVRENLENYVRAHYQGSTKSDFSWKNPLTWF